jgi:hypothetical protein
MPAFASQYASNVLTRLPEDAVLLVWGAERTFPLVEAQVVDGVRRDVAIVNANGLDRPWYREELSARFHLRSDVAGKTGVERAAALAAATVPSRPVYLDAVAMRVLRDAVAFQPAGVVGRVGRRAGPDDGRRTAELLEKDYALDGVYDDGARFKFPNRNVVFSYEQAHLEAARIALSAGDEATARRQIKLAQRINPTNKSVQRFLDDLDKRSSGG